MRTLLFANRITKEVLRDPINLAFGLGFPLALLVLLSAVNANIPPEADNPMFAIGNLAPGMAMFGSVFMALFVGMIVAKDRTSSFLTRLFTSPMTASDFLVGYAVPMVVMALAQSAITLLAACFFGLSLSITILPAICVAGITSALFIGIGLLTGSLMNDKAVGGICGALLTNVAGWLSGIFIPISLIGGAFETITMALPFYHSVEAIRHVLAGEYADIMSHLAIVLGYTAIIFVLAIGAFRRKMSSGTP